MSMNHTEHDRVIALAGLYQSTALVRQVAERGSGDERGIRTIVESVLRLDAPSVEGVYGNLAGLRLGLETLTRLRDRPNVPATRYAVAILHLERKLSARREALDSLADGIKRAGEQAEYFGSPTHENVIAALADLYVRTISNLGPRVMVHGEPTFLANPNVANMIRCLLLGAMRSAVLWRQVGGSRWRLILAHRRMLEQAQALLKAAEAP